MTKAEADHVVARFNGADLTFHIARADLDLFEAYGPSAYHRLRAISSGDWKVRDLKFVLAFALLDAAGIRKVRRDVEQARRAGIAPGVLSEMRKAAGECDLLHNDAIEAAFATRAPGDYASLAIAILTAALLGIEPADAVFSDENDGA